LLNKADFLTEEIRLHWNQYFKEKGVEHIFFSAKEETEILEAEVEEEKAKQAALPQVDSDLMAELKEEIQTED
jgi:ribosome biogenesis GTPase A